jgi:hypothetical protein
MPKNVDTRPAHLRVVRHPELDHTDDRGSGPVQRTLFPFAGTSICIVDMPMISDDEFALTVKTLAPVQILDLRTVPAFDVGRLNRHRAFELFESQGSAYVDVAGLIGARSRRDARLNVDYVVDLISSQPRRDGNDIAGPIMILMDDSDAVRNAAVHLPDVLPARSKKSWDIHVLTSARKPNGPAK